MTDSSTRARRGRDLLTAPLVGPFLRWRHARTVLQSLLLAVSAVIILDGLFGPQLAPKNMAGILPWVHWRGFVALALLVAGNLFCMACPFMLPRRLAKKVFPANGTWPRALRSKWLALILLFLFLWAYEAFDLWATPWWTAWLALAYFAAAFVIDGFFKGAAFCKHVCPIGHFHFVNSAASPLEVAIRDPEVCAGCATRECIVGVWEKPRALAGGAPETAKPRRTHERGKLLQNGCELWLYQETKRGNMDCTFCMECIHACPYDNIGILTRPPAQELWEDPLRAGVGRFSQRPDLAALALFLTFAAFLNAFGMVSPVYALEGWLAGLLGVTSGPILVGIIFLFGMVFLPGLLVGVTAWASAAWSSSGKTVVQEATRYGYALVPVGFGMWVAHYLFHFLIGGLAIIPATQEYLSDLGLPILGSPAWSLGPMVPESWLLPLELLFLELGLLVSLVVAFRIAQREVGPGPRALKATLPWSALALALSIAGIWLLLQPMEMRGTLMAG
ncbi:MAG: FesM [Gemmatimonadota bacterium]